MIGALPPAALGWLHRTRLAVAALVIGVAFAMDAADPVAGRRLVLAGLALAILAATAVYAALARRSVPVRALLLAELALDVAASTCLVLLTGGPVGQFVLLYPLVAFAGGMLLGVRGGATLGILGAAAFGGVVLLTGRAWPAGPAGWDGGAQVSPMQVAFYPVFFVVVGMLAGLLGRRMAESERALARATREMEKLRLDTESIVQNLSSGLLTIDRAGRLVHFNRVAEQLLGQPAEAVRGRTLAEALAGESRELVDKVLATLGEGIPLLRAEVRLSRADREPRPLGLSTSLLRDGTGATTGVVALFQDLTEVRRLEAASRRQDRLSVIGGMAASIAHEVRNCVNPISGSVEMLQQELDLGGENRRLLELIAREAEQMERLVSELLTFTRGDPLHVREVTLENLLDATLDRIRSHPAWRPSVALRAAYRPGRTPVAADPEQLGQVFFNLALNAVEAMGPVGSLTIRVEPAGSPGGDCVVDLADTGPGMSRETLDRIFEPYYSTKGSGTGLGLAIAHRIVERHRGRLEVTSRPGSGTRVRVYLPGAGAETAGVVAEAAVA